MTKVRTQDTKVRCKIKELVTHHSLLVTNKRGFTLIEIAIVLVIIGIIIGAVLKGQDMIENARHKKLANEVKKFETLAWGFLDRKGYFPGDSNKNGVIGETGENPQDDITTKGRFLDPPTSNSITLGSYTFYIWFGNDGGTTKKNIIAVTNSDTTANAFSDAELAYVEAFDTSIDGAANGADGRVRAATAITVSSASWLATAPTITGDWTSATKALIYYFDRK